MNHLSRTPGHTITIRTLPTPGKWYSNWMDKLPLQYNEDGKFQWKFQRFDYFFCSIWPFRPLPFVSIQLSKWNWMNVKHTFWATNRQNVYKFKIDCQVLVAMCCLVQRWNLSQYSSETHQPTTNRLFVHQWSLFFHCSDKLNGLPQSIANIQDSSFLRFHRHRLICYCNLPNQNQRQMATWKKWLLLKPAHK